jgi:antitoxin (DNA-binding transcriptional repressor) of toxin-antitoxin stability system
MEAISISNLKTHLSATLKEVVKGIHYLVMDRDHPIAELVPYSEKKRLKITTPKSKSKKIQNSFKGEVKFDALEYLFQDRRGKRF